MRKGEAFETMLFEFFVLKFYSDDLPVGSLIGIVISRGRRPLIWTRILPPGINLPMSDRQFSAIRAELSLGGIQTGERRPGLLVPGIHFPFSSLE